MDEQQQNPFPTGSPGGSPTGGGAADIPGVEVALRMVAATEAAARAAQKAVEMVESAALKATGDENRSWWKLLPKPPTSITRPGRQKSLDGKNGRGCLSSMLLQ